MLPVVWSDLARASQSLMGECIPISLWYFISLRFIACFTFLLLLRSRLTSSNLNYFCASSWLQFSISISSVNKIKNSAQEEFENESGKCCVFAFHQPGLSVPLRVSAKSTLHNFEQCWGAKQWRKLIGNYIDRSVKWPKKQKERRWKLHFFFAMEARLLFFFISVWNWFTRLCENLCNSLLINIFPHFCCAVSCARCRGSLKRERTFNGLIIVV